MVVVKRDAAMHDSEVVTIHHSGKKPSVLLVILAMLPNNDWSQ